MKCKLHLAESHRKLLISFVKELIDIEHQLLANLQDNGIKTGPQVDKRLDKIGLLNDILHILKNLPT